MIDHVVRILKNQVYSNLQILVLLIYSRCNLLVTEKRVLVKFTGYAKIAGVSMN